MAVRIQFRRGTSTEWSSANPVLAEGELGFESDTKVIKFGDGTNPWSTLPVAAAGDITAVIAGPGLQGGATSGQATLSINESYVITASSIDAPGDLIVGAGPDTYARLPVGANGSVLVADSSQSVGVRWAAASSSSGAVVPTGTILPFAGSSVPAGGFLLCDGQPVSRSQYSDLFNTIGITYGAGDGSSTFNVPNLRGRVPVGFLSGDTDFGVLAGTPGNKITTIVSGTSPGLNEVQVPGHAHTITFTSGGGTHDHLNVSTQQESPQHSHGVNISSDGSTHTHSVRTASINTPASGFFSAFGLSNPNSVTTEAGEGSHTHNNSSTSGGSHSHSLSISGTGTHTHSANITNSLPTSSVISRVQPSLVINYIIKT